MKTAEELTTLFRERGLRVTPQRQAIFRLLHGNDVHPTVEALHDRARTDMPTISLKTVYQTVHDLEALGEVRVLDLGTGSVRVDPNVDGDHHHLVCTECGRVQDVPLARESMRLPSNLRRDFTVEAVEVIYRGRCSTCS
jgi:Fe2+ or Zn2+ uptake regulation protein